MANSFLSRTPGSTTDAQRKQFTISMWVKRSTLLTGSSHQELVSTNATDQFGFRFQGDNKLDIFDYSVSGNNYPLRLVTNRLFRDTSAWYNIILQVDTPNATSSNRVKLWVNGVQETSFGTATYPSQDYVTTWNKNGLHQIGSKAWGNSGNGQNFFDGYISHLSNVAGSVVAPTVFGQTDSTSGIWKFKQPSGVTWGNNGFHLKFENSAALGTDSSGNTNTFTVNGNLKQALDTPSNVYATLNPLALGPNSVLSNASNTCAMNAAAQFGAYSTLGVNSGKWYMEMKYSARTHSYDRVMVGIAGNPNELRRTPAFVGQPADPTSYGYYVDGNRYQNDNATTYGSSYTVGDIIGIALDLENNRLFFSKNGTWQDSGDPTSSTGAISITAPSSTVEGSYFFAVSDTTGSYGGTIQCNFGNGFFGTTAITSAGSNGNGSLFEYDVPSGYYALNTKNINTYG